MSLAEAVALARALPHASMTGSGFMRSRVPAPDVVPQGRTRGASRLAVLAPCASSAYPPYYPIGNDSLGPARTMDLDATRFSGGEWPPGREMNAMPSTSMQTLAVVVLLPKAPPFRETPASLRQTPPQR